MAYSFRPAPEQRELLADAHRKIASAHADIKQLIAEGVEGLEWVDHSLIDAGSDVIGLFNASEPMSFR